MSLYNSSFWVSCFSIWQTMHLRTWRPWTPLFSLGSSTYWWMMPSFYWMKLFRWVSESFCVHNLQFFCIKKYWISSFTLFSWFHMLVSHSLIYLFIYEITIFFIIYLKTLQLIFSSKQWNTIHTISSFHVVPEQNQDPAAGAGSRRVGRPGPRRPKRKGVKLTDVWTAGTLPQHHV